MAEDVRRKRLDDLIRRRDEAQKILQRTQGRLESARADVRAIEDECRKKNLDPSKLDETLLQLEERYDKAVADLESQIRQVELEVAPFVGD